MTTEAQLRKLKLYQAELDNSKRWRKQFEKQWQLFLMLYSHKDPLFCGENLGKDKIQVNYIHSTVNTIMDSTLHRYPKITLTSRNANTFRESVIAESALNQQWQTKGWQRPHRLTLLDKIIMGHGWTKTTYQFEQEEREMSEREFLEAFNEAKTSAIAVAREGKKPFPTDEDVRESIEAKGTYTLKDEVQIERVSPFDIFVDPGGKDLDSISWIAQRVSVQRRHFVEDERFSQSVRDRFARMDTVDGGNGVLLSGNSLEMQDETIMDEIGDGISLNFVQYVEFYDITDGTVSWFLEEGGNDYLIDPMPMPYAFGQPFDMQRGTEVPDRFYPMGEVEIVVDQQRELNQTRTDMLNDRKKGSRQYLYKPDNVSEEFEVAMKSDEEQLLIPVESDVNFSDVMAELPFQARIRPELYDQSSLFLQDIFQLTGITDYQRGGGASSRTATQVAVENDASLARQGRQLRSLEENMATSARRALQLMQQFMSTRQVLRISNVGEQYDASDEEGFEQKYSTVWYEYGREDIGGEFDVLVEAGSTRPMNDSTRAQRALQVMNAALPFMQLQVLQPTQLMVYILRELGVPNPESWVQQGADPRGVDTSQVVTPPSVAGGVGPIGANVLPEQQPGQGDGAALAGIRAQLEGQIGLPQ